MKTKNTAQAKQTDFQTQIRRALACLDGGNPDTAIEFLQTASALAPDLDALKTCEKAIDEAQCGTVEKAEYFLETLISDFDESQKSSHRDAETQSKPQHTPGPWHTAAKFEPYQSAPAVYSGNRKIAECRESVCFTAEDVANARLIAAAPELLDALRGLLRFAEIGEGERANDFEAITEARAAISKATGQK